MLEKKKNQRRWSKKLAGKRGRLFRIVTFITLSADLLCAQVTVSSQPPVVLAESSVTLSLTAQVSGTLPGESAAVRWSLNDVPLATTPIISFSPANGPAGVPLILKASSVFDPSKFAAVPVIRLEKSERGQINFPEAIAYHPSTGKVYVASLVARGNAIDTNIVEMAPDGTQNRVATLSSELIDKLLPYRSSAGTPYLLAMGFTTGSVNALDLNTRTSRRVVGGLDTPVSGGFHPDSGDLYIAEQNARRISVVSRSALESALGGTSTAPFQALPVTIPQISGIGFLAEGGSKTISLLASTTSGAFYKVKTEDNTFSVVATGLQSSQEVLVLQSSQLGVSLVFTARSANIDGQGQISALVSSGSDQPFGPTYPMASGLDVPTDIAFLPAGNSYSPTGRPAIVVANSSPTLDRGKVILWEIEPLSPSEFHFYSDRAQPSLSFLSPTEGDVLAPGVPVEIRWRYTDSNPLNPSYGPFPGPVQISVSTDQGRSFSPAGPFYSPSGPEGNDYSQLWHVPADLAGMAIRLRLETPGLGGKALTASSGADVNVLPMADAVALPLVLEPNFIGAGQDANVAVYGLNFKPGATVAIGGVASVSSSTESSSTRLLVRVTSVSSVPGGPHNVSICNDPDNCGGLEGAFFVLPQDGPRITGIEPPSGSPGATVVITGNNFSGIAANNRVQFGDRVATVSQAQPTRLVLQVPFGLTRRKSLVRVETNGIPGNAADFFLVPSGLAFPSIHPVGIVNGASFSPSASALAAGSIASVFGVNMAPSILTASSLPLARELLNTTVLIGGIPSPLFFIAPNQMNIQLPEELAGMNSAAVTVVSRGVMAKTTLLNLAIQSPGIFSADSSGRGPGAVLNQNGSRNGLENPERVGNSLQVYATGLGATDPPAATGMAALAVPLSSSVNSPQATIDGRPALVSFAGRAPGFAGVDQVNVVIPPGVTTGRPVPLVISSQSTAVSNTVTVVIAP